MTSITDIIKEGLDYPKANLNYTSITGIFLLLCSIFFVFGSYFVSENFKENALTNPIGYDYNSVFQLLNYVSPTTQALFVIFMIIAIIFYLIAQGYFYRIYENTVLKQDENIGYDNFKSIFVEGLKLLVVNISYLIIPVILISVGGYYTPVLSVIGVILLIIAYFILPIALSNMAYNKSFKSAYRFNEIGDILKSIGIGKYIGTILFELLICGIILFSGIIIFLILTVIIGSLPALNLMVGFIIISIFFMILYSYLISFSVRVNGLLYNDGKDI